MQKRFLFGTVAAFAFLVSGASAAPPAVPTLPPDVPARHFAAGAVQRVVRENIMGRTPDGRFDGNQPVTRYELAVALDRFVRYIEAGHKPLHVERVPGPAPLPSSSQATPTERHALAYLVTNGFLPAASPLLTKNGHTPATAQELTDALASVTIRLSDRAEAPRKD